MNKRRLIDLGNSTKFGSRFYYREIVEALLDAAESIPDDVFGDAVRTWAEDSYRTFKEWALDPDSDPDEVRYDLNNRSIDLHFRKKSEGVYEVIYVEDITRSEVYIADVEIHDYATYINEVSILDIDKKGIVTCLIYIDYDYDGGDMVENELAAVLPKEAAYNNVGVFEVRFPLS